MIRQSNIRLTENILYVEIDDETYSRETSGSRNLLILETLVTHISRWNIVFPVFLSQLYLLTVSVYVV